MNNPKIVQDGERAGPIVPAEINQSLPAEPVRKAENDLEVNHYQNNTITVADQLKDLGVADQKDGEDKVFNLNGQAQVQGQEIELKDNDLDTATAPAVVPSQFRIYQGIEAFQEGIQADGSSNLARNIIKENIKQVCNQHLLS